MSPVLRQRLWLLRNGVPWDEAWALDEVECAAFAVVFGEFETGKTYNWEAGRYDDK